MYNSHMFGSKPPPRNPIGKRPHMPNQDQQNWQQPYAPGYDYQSYYAAWQNYQSQQPYYGYDQNYGSYGTNYQYPPAATPYSSYPAYPPNAPPAPEEPVPQESTTAPSQTEQSSDQYYNSASYDATESTLVEDHDTPVNSDILNKAIIQRNEELFDAVDDVRWLPQDGLDPPYAKGK